MVFIQKPHIFSPKEVVDVANCDTIFDVVDPANTTVVVVPATAAVVAFAAHTVPNIDVIDFANTTVVVVPAAAAVVVVVAANEVPNTVVNREDVDNDEITVGITLEAT